MSFRDIDLLPDETSRAIVKELEKFTAAVMRPAGIELDKYPVATDVFARTSPFWNVLAAFRGLDLHLAGIPETLGGLGFMDGVTAVLAAERLGHADPGLAFGLGDVGAPFRLAARLGTPVMEDLARQFCQDREGCLLGCQAVSAGGQPAAGPTLTARPAGGDLLLTGTVSGLVNAAVATHGAFDVRIVSPDGTQTRGLAIMALDQAGVFRETPTTVVSQRSWPRGGLRFDNTRVPGEWVVTEKEAPLPEIGQAVVIESARFLAAVYAGLARAALDEALPYAKQRVQGGVPIISHGNIRLQLFHMFKMVEAARAGVLRLAGYHDRQGMAGTWPHALAARCLAVEAACQVTSEAIQIFGGYGLAREFPLEKFFRDARWGLAENGVNEDLAMAAMLTV